jgi:hypothetical protein
LFKESTKKRVTEMDYKLLYFNVRGLGEPIRLMLHDNGIAYKEELVSETGQN